MPNHTTLAPDDKGASDKVLSPPRSELQIQLAKHRAFHERVKAINSALRKAKIVPTDSDAAERSREVLRGVLQDERFVEMYLRHLWQVGRAGRYVAFPTSVLVRNGQTVRALLENLNTETQTGRTGATNTRRPTATYDSTHDGESQ